MFQFLTNLFSGRKPEDAPTIETKYFEKYRHVVSRETVLQLLQEYKSGDIIFEPIRNQLTRAEQEELYMRIDKSDFLSPQEKIEAIVGLMMLLDGSFPEPPMVSHLGKVFGTEFVESIHKKREGFKTDIAVKKLIRFVKWKYGRKRRLECSRKRD